MCGKPCHIDLQLKRLVNHLSKISHRHVIVKILSLVLTSGLLKKNPYNFRPQYSSISASRYCPNFDNHCDKLIEELTAFHYSGYWVGMEPFQRNELLYNCYSGKEQLASILNKFLHNVITEILSTQNADYYLEKNTWNILWFDKVLELLPGAKLVHIYRDPRDVIASYINQSWMPADPVKSAIIYRDIMNRWHKIKNKIPPDSFLEVSLESLVTNPKETMYSICTFWGIPWSDSLLKIDLSQSHSDRWKKELTEDAQREIHPILKGHLNFYGYI